MKSPDRHPGTLETKGMDPRAWLPSRSASLGLPASCLWSQLRVSPAPTRPGLEDEMGHSALGEK